VVDGYAFVLLPSERMVFAEAVAPVAVRVAAHRPAYRVTMESWPVFADAIKRCYPHWKIWSVEPTPLWVAGAMEELAARGRERKQSMVDGE
jgi:hypothetical protein